MKKLTYLIVQGNAEPMPKTRYCADEDLDTALAAAHAEAYGEVTVEDVPQTPEGRLTELHRLLEQTDYIAAKLAEGAATREEYAEQLAQRQAWRDEINALDAAEAG